MWIKNKTQQNVQEPHTKNQLKKSKYKQFFLNTTPKVFIEFTKREKELDKINYVNIFNASSQQPTKHCRINNAVASNARRPNNSGLMSNCRATLRRKLVKGRLHQNKENTKWQETKHIYYIYIHKWIKTRLIHVLCKLSDRIKKTKKTSRGKRGGRGDLKTRA